MARIETSAQASGYPKTTNHGEHRASEKLQTSTSEAESFAEELEREFQGHQVEVAE